MRGFARVLVVLLILVALCYLVLPRLVEDQIAGRLQEQLGLPTEPDVVVSSNFPPELLLGRMDGVQVRADQASLQGIAVAGAQADLTGVDVSVPALLQGDFEIDASGCTLTTEAPPVTIDQDEECLAYLGLSGGESNRGCESR